MAGIQKSLLILAFLNGVTFGLLISVLAPFMYEAGFSGTEFGLLTSGSVASSIAATVLSGYLSDALGARRVLFAGYIVKALAFTLIASGNTALMAIGFLLQGISMGVSWSAGSALVSRSGRDETLHFTFSYFAAASTLGAALGSFSGGLPVAASKFLGVELLNAYRTIILALAPLSLIQAFIALLVREFIVGGRARSPISGYAKVLRERRFLVLLAFNMVIGLGASMSIHNIGYYFAAKYGVTSAEIGFVNGLEQLVMALLMIYTPRIASVLGSPLKAYLFLASSSIPLLVAITFVDSFLLAAGLYVVRTILMNAANPLLEAITLKQVPRAMRGSAASLLSLSFTVPAALGRSLGGFMLDIDLELPLRTTALLYLTALSYLYTRKDFIEGKKEPKEPRKAEAPIVQA